MTAQFVTKSCFATLALGLLVGCGGGSASVGGKVTHDGAPVTGGTLQFRPIAAAGAKDPGMPSSGEIKSDGTYSLGREKENDGAIVGRHQVIYTAPAGQLDAANAKPGDLPTPSPFEGLVPKQSEVEVKAGKNSVDIELVKPTR